MMIMMILATMMMMKYRRTCLSKSKGRPKPPVEAETYQKLYRWILWSNLAQMVRLVKFGTDGSFGEIANLFGEIDSSLWTTFWSIEITLSTFPVISLIENFNKSTSFVKILINPSLFFFSRFFERHNQIFFSLINKFDFDWTYKPKLPEPSTIGNGDTWERLFWYDVFGKQISLHISLNIYLCIFMYKVVLLALPEALYVPMLQHHQCNSCQLARLTQQKNKNNTI